MSVLSELDELELLELLELELEVTSGPDAPAVADAEPEVAVAELHQRRSGKGLLMSLQFRL